MDRILRRHLEPIARDQRRGQLLHRLAWGWLVWAVVAAVFLGLNRLTGWKSPWLFPVLSLAAAGWTLLVCRRSARRPLDYTGLARQIEQENPSLHAVLLTAVEQQPDPATHELNFLQERLIREALVQDGGRAWQTRVKQRLEKLRLAGAAAALVLTGLLLSLYEAPATRTTVRSLFNGGVTVTPGDTSLEKGSSLVVLAKFGGTIPTDATLVIRPANEPERRVPLTRNLEDSVFGASLPSVQSELTYQVEFGGASTPTYRVTVFEFPRLERADAKISYPAYTALPEKRIEDTRRVSAVEGSALEYTFHLNKPVSSAALVPKEGPRLALHPDPSRTNVYTSQFKLEKSARYELILVDDAGRTNRMPPQFVLDALTNRVPELKFAFPKGDQRVSALEEMAFQAEVSDDFGLPAYGIAYNLAGQEPVMVELGHGAGPLEKRSFNHLVPLERLGAQPDELMSYYIWADDIGPDGQVRRTASDMFFAEVRPFEEIFREGQPQDPNQAQQQQQQQGQQGGNESERLAELQKQIITATWNLQRREGNRSPSPAFPNDAGTVKESQEKALEQMRSRREESDDPRQAALIETVEKAMEKAVTHLGQAADEKAVKPLAAALSAEQSAYQALLRLAAREHQVSQGQPGQQGQSSRGSRAQRQLNQLDLRQSQNRYETERQAAPPQDPQQREQLQAFNRLKELAQRQQDVNERLRELQAALQEARTEAEREELRARLKRLQEDQQQMLADVDELRQRMDRPENQSQMANSREQLDQTRSEVQQAAEAMERGNTPQALTSGTRAQQDLQQMRDDFRRQTSSQFAEDMRSLRNQARELSQRQEDIGQKMDSLEEPGARKSLTDSDERKELASQLDEQKQRLETIVKQATDVTQKAEAVEPLLSRQLYDTLRQAAQDDARNLQETTEDLLGQGKLLRTVYDRLRTGKEESKKAVEVAANLLRDGFPTEANNLEERARRSINELKTGVEQAAESVLGDDTEALRRARNEVEELARQLEEEIARGRGQSGTNTRTRTAGTGQRGENQTAAGRGEREQESQGEEGPASRADRQGQQGQGQQQARNQGQPGQGQQPGEAPQSGQGQQPGQGQSAGQGQGQSRELAANDQQNAERNRSGQGRGQRPGEQGNDQTGERPGEQAGQRAGQRETGARQGGGDSFLDQLGGPQDGGAWGGPLTGPGYTQWSDRLRDVEEMLDVPELRAEAARIRDRTRILRAETRRHGSAPQWDLVNMEIAAPLTELRSRISEELARRESREAIVPLDRDPVPKRYAERVRRYYEELGKSE